MIHILRDSWYPPDLVFCYDRQFSLDDGYLDWHGSNDLANYLGANLLTITSEDESNALSSMDLGSNRYIGL